MRRCLWLSVVAVAALAVAAGLAVAGDLYRVEGPTGYDGYSLGVTDDGQVRIVKPDRGGREWNLDGVGQKGKGVLIRVASGKSDKYHRWYLGYDVKGKSKAVVLTRKPGPGSYWDVSPGSGRSTLRPAAGELKGWHLNAGQAELLKGEDGEKFTAYRAVLSKRDKVLPLFKFTELSR